MNRNRSRSLVLSGFVACASLLTAPTAPLAAAQDATEVAEFVSAARSSLSRFLVDPEMVWFQENLAEAEALLIVPKRVRAGFLFGGSGGVGVLIAKDRQTGEWGQPVFYNMGGASLGLQIGGDRSELILVVRNEQALDAFLSSSFRLGGEASVSAGPVGAGTGEQVDASIVAFVRSKGLYAGATLEGTVIRPATDRNRAFYGTEVTPVDILVRRSVVSNESLGLRDDLARAVSAAAAR